MRLHRRITNEAFINVHMRIYAHLPVVLLSEKRRANSNYQQAFSSMFFKASLSSNISRAGFNQKCHRTR